MYKFVVVVLVVAASVFAEPEAKPHVVAAYAAAPVIPGVVTAQSSQVVARNYNTLAAPLVAAAPVVAPAIAPYVASRYVSSPYVASPYVASPYVASPYVASPYVASPYVSAPYVAPAPIVV